MSGLSAVVAEEIRAQMGRQRITKAELSRRMGVSEVWIGRRLNGQMPIGLDDLERIATALGVAPADILPPRVAARPRQHEATGRYALTRPPDRRPPARPAAVRTMRVAPMHAA